MPSPVSSTSPASDAPGDSAIDARKCLEDQSLGDRAANEPKVLAEEGSKERSSPAVASVEEDGPGKAESTEPDKSEQDLEEPDTKGTSNEGLVNCESSDRAATTGHETDPENTVEPQEKISEGEDEEQVNGHSEEASEEEDTDNETEEDEEEDDNDDEVDDDLSSLDGDVLSSPEIDLDLPIQIHSRPDTPLLPLILSLPGPLIDEDTGVMDDAVERHFLNEAEELGVAVPPKPSPRPDPPKREPSLTTVASESPVTQTISRASESTRPTSRSSSVYNAKILVKGPITTSSVPPPLPSPQTQTRNNSPPKQLRRNPPAPLTVKPIPDNGGESRLVKGLKRFSSYTKRRTMMLNKTVPVSSETSLVSTIAASEKTGSSADGAPTESDIIELEADAPIHPRPGSSTTMSTMNRQPESNGLPSLYETSSFISSSPNSPTRTTAGESLRPEELKGQSLADAKQRSLRNRHLQAIRLHQLDEQSQFLEYYFGVIDKVRAKYSDERGAAQVDFDQQKQMLEERFDEQHHEMEERHLSKEFELRNSLDQERQACETKLKHMDAYCNGRQDASDENLPRRKVTEEDYRALLQQYHVRQTMGDLHESRIKVLREKQAKQLERLSEGHLEELDVLQERFDGDEEKRLEAQNKEEEKIKKEFDVKKHRLIWRWKLMETVERRKLELETGEVYGELPDVQWGEDELIAAAL